MRSAHARLRNVLIGIALLALPVAGTPSADATSARLPVGAMTQAQQWVRGAKVSGWAIDPDTTRAITVDITVDGHLWARKSASLTATSIPSTYRRYGTAHRFTAYLHLRSGRYRICAIAHNVGAGASTRGLGCRTLAVADSPYGTLTSVTPVPGGIRAVGWVSDFDAPSTPVRVNVSADGRTVARIRANRVSVSAAAWSARHGFDVTVMLPTGLHRICVAAFNLGPGGSRLGWPCQSVQVRNIAPLPPTAVHVALGRLAATVTWHAPPANGGTPITSYWIRSTGNGLQARVAPATRSVVFPALVSRRRYTFFVYAINLAGTSAASAESNAVIGPPPIIGPVTSPPLISTSRYIRNIRGRSSDATTTRAMGVADAAHNPSNHRYLVLLDIGGQTTSSIGLSATSIYFGYAALESALEAYVDGYHSAQKYNAPAVIALGVNNDIDVSATTGKIWATQVVNPLIAYVRAHHYANLSIAGADDMEPGFFGTPKQTKAWLSGFLANTTARFVFNGSADGCNWTRASGKCNNLWTAADLQWLAGGAAPTRIIALPQIYNTTMAAQWKYISLTGVLNHHPKITFGGPLTEYTACGQVHGSCYSLANNTAWSALWTQLRSDSRVAQSSLTYGTDLRIN